MPATSANLLKLKRRQLDSSSRPARGVEPPRGGWVRAIRTALSMSAAQLGKRLGMSAQGVFDLEHREQDETVSVAKLRQAADALGCDLKVVFVPRRPLTAMLEEQARAKALGERNRITHTMRLEAQADGVDDALDESASMRDWLTTRVARLWD
jgi:predicted DNA-binding mobile mystery protein A